MFIGYPFSKKGYKILDLQSKKCFHSRDVQFAETSFPFQSIHSDDSDSMSYSTPLFPITSSVPEDLLNAIDHTPVISYDISCPSTFSNSDNSEYVPLSQPIITISRPVRNKQLPSNFKDFTGLPASNAALPSSSLS